MNPLQPLLLAILILLGLGGAQAGDIAIELSPDTANPATPTMGDWMHFHSRILNAGSQPIEGLVAWISLVEVTPGREQPMDLEDWSARKAVSGATLAPGASLSTQWPLRLIQGGDYRVVISATDRTSGPSTPARCRSSTSPPSRWSNPAASCRWRSACRSRSVA